MVYFKAIKSWNELVGGSFGSVLWMNHKEHVRKPSSKVGSILKRIGIFLLKLTVDIWGRLRPLVSTRTIKRFLYLCGGAVMILVYIRPCTLDNTVWPLLHRVHLRVQLEALADFHNTLEDSVQSLQLDTFLSSKKVLKHSFKIATRVGS